MRAVVALMIALSAGITWADETPAHVKPFLAGDESPLWVVNGAFGPAQHTTVVIWWDILGSGSYQGFVLVPDAKAKDAYRKLPLPKLPVGVTEGELQVGLIASLDKDPADEVALAVKVSKSGGNHTYTAFEYVVLDWNGRKMVRLSALEKKLAAKMKGRQEGASDPLVEADVRAALGIAKK